MSEYQKRQAAAKENLQKKFTQHKPKEDNQEAVQVDDENEIWAPRKANKAITDAEEAKQLADELAAQEKIKAENIRRALLQNVKDNFDPVNYQEISTPAPAQPPAPAPSKPKVDAPPVENRKTAAPTRGTSGNIYSPGFGQKDRSWKPTTTYASRDNADDATPDPSPATESTPPPQDVSTADPAPAERTPRAPERTSASASATRRRSPSGEPRAARSQSATRRTRQTDPPPSAAEIPEPPSEKTPMHAGPVSADPQQAVRPGPIPYPIPPQRIPK